MLDKETLFYGKIVFNDETHFLLNGSAKKQICRSLCEVQPEALQELPIHSLKYVLWSGLWPGGINGAHFSSTIRQECYCELNSAWITHLIVRYRTICMGEYANIEPSVWTIWDATTANIYIISSLDLELYRPFYRLQDFMHFSKFMCVFLFNPLVGILQEYISKQCISLALVVSIRYVVCNTVLRIYNVISKMVRFYPQVGIPMQLIQ